MPIDPALPDRNLANTPEDHLADHDAIHAFLNTLAASLGQAQTFTEDQTIQTSKNLLVGDNASVLGDGNGLYGFYNCRWNGSNWVRRIADNDASRLQLNDVGDLVFYTSSDAGNTVGSTITWAEKFRITKAGQVQVPVTGSTGGLLVGGDTNLYRGGADLLTTDDALWVKKAGRALALGTSGQIEYFTGTGTPEGSVTASVGAIYNRSDGGAGTTLYVKESGTGNTGWVAVGGGAQVAQGSYTGNGADPRTISLSFTPKFVASVNETDADNYHLSSLNTGTIAANIRSTSLMGADRGPILTTNGFIVKGSTGANEDGKTFHYFAIG